MELLTPRYSYEYDFGSTTELIIKVISEHEARAEKEPIQCWPAIPSPGLHAIRAKNLQRACVRNASLSVTHSHRIPLDL